MDELLGVVVAAAVGAVAGALAQFLAHWLQIGAARRDAERAHLEAALRPVYGPVVRLLSEVEECFVRSHRIHDVAEKHFNQPWHESAMRSVQEEIDATIQTSNDYVTRATECVESALKIMEDGWHLVDAADVGIFDDIRRERIRLKVESQAPDRKRMPFAVTLQLGEMHFYKQEWRKALNESYERKQRRYRRLAGLPLIG